MGRTWMPCRECGDTHQNPRSSSLCVACGVVESKRNQELRELEAQRRMDYYVDPVAAAMEVAYGFDESQTDALRNMFQAFYDAIQEAD